MKKVARFQARLFGACRPRDVGLVRSTGQKRDASEEDHHYHEKHVRIHDVRETRQ
jgi:hypothetical protein